MTSSEPRVSVVMAARNESGVIERAIESILKQTLKDWELIVVDDGSSDGTATLVERYGEPRIRLFREPRRGLPGALNVGITEARSRFVARQDADDVSLPDRLARQARFLDEHGDVAVVGARWVEIGPHGRALAARTPFVHGCLNEALVRFNPIVHTAAMFRRSAAVAVGMYDESFPYAADYDLWLRIEVAGFTLWNLPETLVVRTMTGQNMSSTNERGNLVEELRVRWCDIRRRHRAGHGVHRHAARLAQRTLVLAAPTVFRREVRKRRGQAQ